MLSIRYLDPTARSFDESVLGWLLTELPSASCFRFASAYYEASILDWLEEPLEDLVDRGGSVHALIGSNGGMTDPADLERLAQILRRTTSSTLHVEYAEGGIFHPKVFVIEQRDRVAAIVGSANLTSSGSLINVEAGLVVETDRPGPPPEYPLDAIIASIDVTSRTDVFVALAATDLHRLKGMGIIGRVVKVTATNVNQAQATAQRNRRRQAGVRTRPGVTGVPPRTRRPSPTGVVASPPTPAAPATGDFYGLQFSANDLKDTGTREISLSRSFREWVERVLGRPIAPGEGNLFPVVIDGRLAGSPQSVTRTPEPGRIWAAGGSGGTHQDVRLVLGNKLKADLDEEAVRLTGIPVPSGSVGVFELPTNPQAQPLRLTVFLPSDPGYQAVEGLLARTGRDQKRHFRVNALPQVPLWP
jgi:HKD family nuclease